MGFSQLPNVCVVLAAHGLDFARKRYRFNLHILIEIHAGCWSPSITDVLTLQNRCKQKPNSFRQRTSRNRPMKLDCNDYLPKTRWHSLLFLHSVFVSPVPALVFRTTRPYKEPVVFRVWKYCRNLFPTWRSKGPTRSVVLAPPISITIARQGNGLLAWNVSGTNYGSV